VIQITSYAPTVFSRIFLHETDKFANTISMGAGE